MAFGPVEILILCVLCCVPLVVIICLSVGLVFLNKRLSPSSWIRKILAIVTGVIVNMVGSGVISGIFVAIFALLFALGMSEPNISTTATPILIILSGLLCILGGYIAGKIARQNEIVYGFLTGIGVSLVTVALIFPVLRF